MAAEPKPSSPPSTSLVKQRDHGIRIFTYPKVIFIFPTLVAALICGIGMKLIGNDMTDPVQAAKTAPAVAPNAGTPAPEAGTPAPEVDMVLLKHRRFMTPANLLGV